MKPKEFDDLIVQKFDQNDFEYKPENWALLRERMDNRPGKKRTLLWVPLAVIATMSSMAASVAMFIALPSFFQHTEKATTIAHAHAIENSSIQINTLDEAAQASKPVNQTIISHTHKVIASNSTATREKVVASTSTEQSLTLHLPNFKLIAPHRQVNTTPVFNTFNSSVASNKIPYSRTYGKYCSGKSFHPDAGDEVKIAKTMLGISSGVNYGASISGYSIGATGKRMIGNKSYMEGDVAFVSNTSTQKSSYMPPSSIKQGLMTAKKTLQLRSTDGTGTVPTTPPAATQKITEENYAYTAPASPEMKEDNYNLYYAQVSPCIGYNLSRQISIGVGGDVQHLLLNGATATDNTGAPKEISAFDIGFLGKTECALNKKIKAGLCYRQGVNNLINGSTRYLDRNYLQVQLKYMISKK